MRGRAMLTPKAAMLGWTGALLLLTSACGGGNEAGRDEATSTAPVPLSQLTVAPLVERAAPAVVNIAVLQQSPLQQNPLLRDPYFRRYFGVPDQALQPRLAAGSGFIVDGRRGLILTNHHVVDQARAIEVVLPDRRRF